MTGTSLAKALGREPLVHFLLLGAGIFLLSGLAGGGRGDAGGRIVVSRPLIEQLASGFARTWQRPPSDAELAGLVQDYIKEEVYVREATAMGLDRDDTIIRRRLRQKLEFLSEDTLEARKPTDADLRSFMESHSEGFRVEPRVAFRQVALDPNRRGEAVEEDAKKLLARLRTAGPGLDVLTLGDSRMLPAVVELSTPKDVARLFGDDFAAEIVKLAPGAWSGPVRSGYGLHLVQVTERVEGRQPDLAEVREAVEREWRAAQRREQGDALFRSLVARYKVVIESPQGPPRKAGS